MAALSVDISLSDLFIQKRKRLVGSSNGIDCVFEQASNDVVEAVPNYDNRNNNNNNNIKQICCFTWKEKHVSRTIDVGRVSICVVVVVGMKQKIIGRKGKKFLSSCDWQRHLLDSNLCLAGRADWSVSGIGKSASLFYLKAAQRPRALSSSSWPRQFDDKKWETNKK